MPERRERSWGYYEVLHAEPTCQVRRLVVNPKAELEPQYHRKKNEHWLVIEGKADVRVGLQGKIMLAHNNMLVPAGVPHYIGNPFDKPLVIIEVQYGTKVEDDDAVKGKTFSDFWQMVAEWL